MPSDLDFISRPNPVEPSDLSHGNKPSGHQLDRSTQVHLKPFTFDNRVSQQRRDTQLDHTLSTRPHIQSSGLPIADVLNKDESIDTTPPRPDQTVYTLPKLPLKRRAKQNRVPPVLQGLHEPPPTSRILPSISAEETQVLLQSTRNSRSILNDVPFSDNDRSHIPTSESAATCVKTDGDASYKKRVPLRNKWTDQESDDLIDGVAKFGVGSWKKIVQCEDYKFNKRTAVDLKDRFRVLRPDVYGNPRTKKAKRAIEEKASRDSAPTVQHTKGGLSDAALTVALTQAARDDGQDETDAVDGLWKAKRRKRRKFTEEEDQALFRGYQESGPSWYAIQKDPIFQNSGRTPTDLRDRFRTKFPEDYKNSGLAPRPANFPKPLPRTSGDDQVEAGAAKDAPAQEITTLVPAPWPTRLPHNVGPWHGQGESDLTHRTHVLPLPRISDDYLPSFGSQREEDELEGPIVLDRSIVDWANNTMPSGSNRQTASGEGGTLPGIDPLITLNLPRFPHF